MYWFCLWTEHPILQSSRLKHHWQVSLPITYILLHSMPTARTEQHCKHNTTELKHIILVSLFTFFMSCVQSMRKINKQFSQGHAGCQTPIGFGQCFLQSAYKPFVSPCFFSSLAITLLSTWALSPDAARSIAILYPQRQQKNAMLDSFFQSVISLFW